MVIGERRISIIAVFLLFASIFVTLDSLNVSGYGFDPDITVGFNEYWMDQELAPEYSVSSPLSIHWYAWDSKGTELVIDLFVMNQDEKEWITIAEKVENSGTFIWDLMDPSVTDGEYILKLIAWNPDGGYSFNVSSFKIDIISKKRPDIKLFDFPEGMEVSGKIEVTWDVFDEDTPRHLISSDIYISENGGETYDHYKGFREDPGWIIIDTTELPNDDHYKVRIKVTDQDKLSGEATSNRFFIFNNYAPSVNITSPELDDGLSGKVRIEWEAVDEEDPSEKLRVNLWYSTIHDGGIIDLLTDAPNHGYYNWDTAEAKPGSKGHLICIEIIDVRGLISDRDEVRVWTLKWDDPIFMGVDYPRGDVDDRIDITWNTYEPARMTASELCMNAYHKAPGAEWSLVDVDLPDMGIFSLDVRNSTDGSHELKLVMMDPLNTWIYDEIEVQVEVYHDMEPQMYIRKNPLNETNATGILEFEIAGYDGNGDILTYIGLFGIKGGGWRTFDTKYGNYKQVLRWNTTDLLPGTYEVRVVVFDGSKYNHSISKTLGTYFVEDNLPPPAHDTADIGTDNPLSPIVKAIMILGAVAIMVTLLFGFIARREMTRRSSIDQKVLPINREYIRTYLIGRSGQGLLERLLPTIGGASEGRLITQDASVSDGLDEDEKARLQGYLDMLDPDLIDDVTRSDIDSYGELGVGRNASFEEIRNAYIGFVRRYHPDKLIGKEEKLVRMAQEKLRKKNRAKAILLDPQKRALIDKMIRENESGRIRDLSVKSIEEIRALRKK